ncbi:MAG: hypothetical protein ACRBCL_09090 [Maritimibacter sp.]
MAGASLANPLKPGDLVVPFRAISGGDIHKEIQPDGTSRMVRTNGVLLPTPPEGLKGTCWRILEAGPMSVKATLVKGVYRPHWEEGAAYTEHSDVFYADALFPYPSDMAAGEFSMFRRVAQCP